MVYKRIQVMVQRKIIEAIKRNVSNYMETIVEQTQKETKTTMGRYVEWMQ